MAACADLLKKLGSIVMRRGVEFTKDESEGKRRMVGLPDMDRLMNSVLPDLDREFENMFASENNEIQTPNRK